MQGVKNHSFMDLIPQLFESGVLTSSEIKDLTTDSSTNQELASTQIALRALKAHNITSTEMLSSIKLDPNRNLYSLRTDANTKELIPYAFRLDSLEHVGQEDLRHLKIKTITFIKENVTAKLNSGCFKKHSTYNETNTILSCEHKMKGLCAYSKEQILMPLRSNSAYLLMREQFVERLSVSYLPLFKGLVALATYSEGAALYCIEHTLLFSIGIKAFFGLYGILTTKGGFVSLIDDIIRVLESRNYMFNLKEAIFFYKAPLTKIAFGYVIYYVRANHGEYVVDCTRTIAGYIWELVQTYVKQDAIIKHPYMLPEGMTKRMADNLINFVSCAAYYFTKLCQSAPKASSRASIENVKDIADSAVEAFNQYKKNNNNQIIYENKFLCQAIK